MVLAASPGLLLPSSLSASSSLVQLSWSPPTELTSAARPAPSACSGLDELLQDPRNSLLVAGQGAGGARDSTSK
eukprot:569725-Hanusia_phi.AAC.1